MGRAHWDEVYASKSEAEVSWTQADPALSLALIREVCASGRVIDVGGGTSVLSKKLLEARYSVAVLDISGAAIARAKDQMGEDARRVQWIVADVTASPALGTFDVWHDRAVFHFLVEAKDRAAYVELLSRTIPRGGHAIIATFALNGPERCSGLPVQRYDAKGLGEELGSGFELRRSREEIHHTPWGASQAFQYSVFRRV
jgi:SAM-dependent methyltransferase